MKIEICEKEHRIKYTAFATTVWTDKSNDSCRLRSKING